MPAGWCYKAWAARNGCTLEANHCGLGTLCVHGDPSRAAIAELRAHAPASHVIRVHTAFPN